MNIFTEITIGDLDQEQMELLVARLTDIGFDGFLEDGGILKAYINSKEFNASLLKELRDELGFSYSTGEVKEENWNALWESSFEPVIVDDFVAVRADFHKVVKNVEHEIVITPKMSFGTGHHATTFLMIREMRQYEWSMKRVLDFGTGTGILAILASKCGASDILGIDIDPWSIENAAENILRNNIRNIRLQLSGEIPPQQTFDIILANINLNILLEHAQTLCKILNKGGILIMSGILAEDQSHMEEAFSLLGKPLHSEVKNNWLMISFMKEGHRF